MTQSQTLKYGIILEISAVVLALGASSSLWGWYLLFMMHAAASASIAMFTYFVLPERLRKPRLVVLSFNFLLCLAFPLLGPATFIAIGLYLRKHPYAVKSEADYKNLAMPNFDVNLSKAAKQRVVGLAARALHTPTPTEKKLQAIMTLQETPSAASTQLLRTALRDNVDEIRLLAYAILDRQEKTLMKDIIRLQQRLEVEKDSLTRLQLLRQLGELHWELIYRNLVQGELAGFLLDRATEYVNEATKQQSNSIHLRLLRAKIMIRKGNQAQAKRDLLKAYKLGAAASQTFPYLAEIAFHERNFEEVRQWLGALGETSLSPHMQRLRQCWVLSHG